jgi:hypothetical protein
MDMTNQDTAASATTTLQVRPTQLVKIKGVAKRLDSSENTARKFLRERGVLPVTWGRSTWWVEHEVEAAIASMSREGRSMPNELASARGLTKPKA